MTKNEGKSNSRIGRKKSGPRKNLSLQKKFNRKKVMKALLLITRVELEKEGSTQNLGKKEQRILKIRLVILMRKRLS